MLTATANVTFLLDSNLSASALRSQLEVVTSRAPADDKQPIVATVVQRMPSGLEVVLEGGKVYGSNGKLINNTITSTTVESALQALLWTTLGKVNNKLNKLKTEDRSPAPPYTGAVAGAITGAGTGSSESSNSPAPSAASSTIFGEGGGGSARLSNPSRTSDGDSEAQVTFLVRNLR